ncbi:hypothetical protein Tco_0946022, partial [Tanacetum coccineum]
TPAMLAGIAVDQGEGSAQLAEPQHIPVDPISSTSQPPIPSPPHPSPPFSPPHYSPPGSYKAPLPEGNTSGSAEDSLQLKDLMVLVPTLVTRITSLENELKETKQTLGNVMLKLVKKVKSLETALKRKSKKVLISESECKESEDQGRNQDINDDPLASLVRESVKEKSTDFVTPTKASEEAQEEEISPTILEATKTLLKVASQGVSKEKSTDKGKRYMRRARSMAKKIDTGLDAEEEVNTGREEINTGIEEVSTGSTKIDSGTAGKRGQREGKAPMVEEDIQITHKTKEQMRQEQAGLEEAIKLQAQLDKEVAKHIHLDKMIAKRMAEEEALSELTMFDPPLNEDAIWSLPLQQKMVSWRYYDKCEVHCLTLEACTIYMLADRKYPLSKEACQVMLEMMLLEGKNDEFVINIWGKLMESKLGLESDEVISSSGNVFRNYGLL